MRFASFLLLVVCGCTSAPSDPDAGPATDAGSDAGAPGDDAGSSLDDAGPIDGGPSDAGADASTDAGPPSCADRYGSAQEFMLCAERPTECEFYTRLDSVRTCQSVCESAGGACIGAWNEVPDPGQECVRNAVESCATGFPDLICICTR